MRVVAGELVQRDDELAEVAALLRRAQAGEGGVLLLQGLPGIGKTALLDAAAAMASERPSCEGTVERSSAS